MKKEEIEQLLNIKLWDILRFLDTVSWA